MSKPKEILELEKIYGITLNSNNYELGNNGKVITLDLSGNQISEIRGLEQFTQLQLHLFANQISEIKGLDQLTHLQILYLYNNQILEINGLEQLTQLQELYLSGNQISEIKNLKQLTQLQVLDLSDNQILKIKGLERLKRLQILYLSDNQISEIKGLEQLMQLQELNLVINHIESIEPIENIIESLNILRIYNNRFSNPLLRVEKNNLQDVKIYFQNLAKSYYPVALPAKVMLLGNHASGKTSFLEFFKTGELLDTETKSTEILSINQYPENKPDTLPEAMIYDFGGQDYYHGLYKAFFSEDSINVLIWCNSLDKNQIRMNTRDFTRSFWLHQLPYYSKMRNSNGKEPIILVQTHADIDNEKNRFNGDSTFFNIVDELFVALRTQENPIQNRFNLQTLSYLKSRLLYEIRKKRTEQKKPAYYENFLKKVLNTKGKNYTNVNELLVEKEQTLVELTYELNQMHLRGLVMYYRDTLPEVVWTDPTATVKYIYDDILSKAKYGFVKKDIFETEICHDEKIRTLLMEEKIIFCDNSNISNIQYIIPMQLPLLESEGNIHFKLLKSFTKKPNLILKFKNFIPFGLINQLICLFGVHPDDEKQFWRDQLIFTFNQEYKVWIQLDFSTLEITVNIHKKNSIEKPYLSLSELEKLIIFNIIDLYNGNEIIYYWDNGNELSIGKKGYEWKSNHRNLSIKLDTIKEYIQRRKIDTPEDLYISIEGKPFLQYSCIEEMKENKNTVTIYPKSNEKSMIANNIIKDRPISKTRRFKIAISFPGDCRDVIESIANRLSYKYSQDQILYDHFHKAEFARPNLDLYLQNLYHNESELIVVCLCRGYDSKPWCGLEWRAIRDLINNKRNEIMFLRTDKGIVNGLFDTTDGYIDVSKDNIDEVVKLIIERHSQQQQTFGLSEK